MSLARAWLVAALFALGVVACNVAFASGPPAGDGWVQCAGNHCVGQAEEGVAWQWVVYERETGVCTDAFIATPSITSPGDGLDDQRVIECATDGTYSTWIADTGASMWMRKLYTGTEPPGEPASAAGGTQEDWSKLHKLLAGLLGLLGLGIGAHGYSTGLKHA